LFAFLFNLSTVLLPIKPASVVIANLASEKWSGLASQQRCLPAPHTSFAVEYDLVVLARSLKAKL